MKKITGSWIELHHMSILEGKYFNDNIKNYSDEDFRELVRNMHEFGIKYLVLMQISHCDSNDNIPRTHYDSKYFPKSDLTPYAKDPIEDILDEADKLGMLVFVSVGFFNNWVNVYDNMTKEEVYDKAFKGMKEVYDLYHHHKSFYGWYYPDESEISYHFDEFFIDYCNRYSKYIHSLDKNFKTLIAPYGTCKLKVDDIYIDQLRRLDVDYVVYQDEVGVRKTDEYHTAEFYKNLKYAHDTANRSKMWADMEVFEFEDKVYKSALLPAPIDRIERQIKAIENYVDEILIFEYQCSFSKPNSSAKSGHDRAEKLYNDYMDLINRK